MAAALFALFSFKFRRLKLAALSQQSTSFAYTSSRSKSGALMQIQPMLSYELGRGWYLTSSDATWKINLRHRSSTEIPVSVGVGKVWKFTEDYSINSAVSGEWMVFRQFSPQAEQFSLNFHISLLLPRLDM